MNTPTDMPEKLRQEHRLEGVLARGLIIGVAISAGVTLLGAILYLLKHASDPVTLKTFAGEPDSLRSIPAIVRAALTLDPAAIIQLGVVLLIATPIARVLFSLLVFAAQKDRLYVVISAGVLGLLLLGFLGVTH